MLPDILDEHLDEAAWLFERRQALLADPAATDEALAEVEERLRAHVDGFVLGGEASWASCRGFLSAGAAGQCFVAATAALEGGDPARREELEAALPGASPEVYDGVRWACRLTTWPDIVAFLRRQLDRPEPTPRAVALDALTGRRLDPGPALTEALSAPQPLLAVAALVGAGRLGLAQHARAVEARTSDEDPEVAAAARASLAVLDPAAAGRG